MQKSIFRGYPARAQCYIAERREQEGWFDETGWTINDWFPQTLSDPDGPKRSLKVGESVRWAAEPWELTHQMYRTHGEKNGLYKTPDEVRNLTPEALNDYQRDRYVTNFDHFFYKSMVEQLPEAVAARKLFYEANELYKQAEVQRAIRAYEDPRALGPPETWAKDKATGWKRILLNHPDFRRDVDTQEDAYNIQVDYFRALYKDRSRLLRASSVSADCLALLPSSSWLAAVRLSQSLLNPPPPPLINGPFDDVDEEGKPLVSPEAMDLTHTRKGMPPPTLGTRKLVPPPEAAVPSPQRPGM
jgi:hypothetical protein